MGGGGRRKGSFAMYLEPWHADVFDFLELRKNHGKEEQRARDLFYGLWVPDLFMQRVKDNADWTLFCPNEAFDAETGKGLMDIYGEEFETLYKRLESEGKGRKTVQANRHLLRDLIKRGLWTEDMRTQLVAHNGSVQQLPLSEDMKELYKTVWEIKQRVVIDMAADRGAYIDQSQSLNIHMVDATSAKLSSMHFHGWGLGLKTGIYYLRTKAAADAIKFTVDVDKVKAAGEKAAIENLKADEPKNACVGCSA